MGLIRSAPARPRTHTLRVSEVTRLTEDAVAVGLWIPEELRETFAFRPGQHLTVRVTLGGQDARRSYSICVSPRDARERGKLRVAAVRVDGGLVSTWLTESVRPGDELVVVPPMGEFVVPPATGRRHHAAIAAGSGITPVLSIVTWLLQETQDAVTLVFGNRTRAATMFADDLDALAAAYPERFRLLHMRSREPGDSELLSGRLDAPRIGAIVRELVPPSGVDEWYLCGPAGVVAAGHVALAGVGVGAAHVHDEVFFEEPPLG